MWLSYLSVGLTYLVIGFLASIIVYFVFKKQVPGNFPGALVVGFIGSFLGGLIYQIIPGVFNALTDVNYVNVYTAFGCAFALVWILAKLSSK